MRLTPWEEERLLIFTAAELARRHLANGVRLSQPEAVALICDTMLEAARAGADYDGVLAAGRSAVAPTDLIDGVAQLVDEVRLEVLFDDGPRLVVLVDPVAAGAGAGPGEIRLRAAPMEGENARDRIRLTVRNESRRVVRVSSHYPFDRANPRLSFDREAAVGCRLDLPAGATERWAPGETREVKLVRYARDLEDESAGRT